MEDKLIIEHGDKMYAVAVADLAPFEVADDATKAEFAAERDAATVDSGDEVEGFVQMDVISARTFIIRR